jgi:hypothetical protein
MTLSETKAQVKPLTNLSMEADSTTDLVTIPRSLLNKNTNLMIKCGKGLSRCRALKACKCKENTKDCKSPILPGLIGGGIGFGSAMVLVFFFFLAAK